MELLPIQLSWFLQRLNLMTIGTRGLPLKWHSNCEMFHMVCIIALVFGPPNQNTFLQPPKSGTKRLIYIRGPGTIKLNAGNVGLKLPSKRIYFRSGIN